MAKIRSKIHVYIAPGDADEGDQAKYLEFDAAARKRLPAGELDREVVMIHLTQAGLQSPLSAALEAALQHGQPMMSFTTARARGTPAANFFTDGIIP